MKKLPHLFENNRKWAERMESENPGLLKKMSSSQAPSYFWIGCSDSRVLSNEIIGLPLGELFVHRNVANQVIHTDFNCLSSLHYAVDVLKVEHVIICGHYGCGGIRAVVDQSTHGLVDNWLGHISDIYRRNRVELEAIDDASQRADRLSELNVREQVGNAANTSVIQEAWARDQQVSVHGWIYGLADGLLKDLDVTVSSCGELRALDESEG